ncbi:unnamed protein product [Ectocarpus fasciculatus]
MDLSMAPTEEGTGEPSNQQLNDDKPRVILLGGGLAGLRCAQRLVAEHGFSTENVVLLEASTRIGGRIKTDRSFIEGFSVDLGAELLHGDQTSLFRLAEEKGWEMEELISLAQGDGGPLPADSNDGWGLFYVGSEKRMLALDSKDPDFVHLNDYLGSLADLWPAIKLTEGELVLEDEDEDEDGPSETSPVGLIPPPSTGGEAAAATTTATVIPPQPLQQQRRRRKPLSLRDGLKAAGVGKSMMGVADAGYANTVGAALEDTNLAGTCYIEHEWDVDGDRTFVLKGSLGQVVDELSAGLESCIQTDWPVSKVECTASGLTTVTCRDGRVEQGTHVVSALPLSVLQDGDVEFVPPLPEAKLTAFQHMGLCSIVKVVLKFDRLVLPPLLHGCICSESFIPEFWFRHMPNLPEGGYTMLAVGFAAGPRADAVTSIKPEEALKKALDQLDDMFRGRKWLEGGGCTGKGDWEEAAEGNTDTAPEHCEASEKGCVRGRQGEGTLAELPSSAYVEGLVHDWVKDEPFVRGGYCYPRIGFDETTHAHLAASVNGTLFFAGEHTNTPTGTTVHAAIDSGDRAASDVLQAVQRAAKERASAAAAKIP